MEQIITALQSLSELKTVGRLDLLAQLRKASMQRHQLPAAVLLPETEIAEPNRFIGGYVQLVSVKIELLLIEILEASPRQDAASQGTYSATLAEEIIKTLSGLAMDGQVLNYQSIDTVEPLGSLEQGQVMRKITFDYTKYRKK